MTDDRPLGMIAAARQLGEDGVLGADPSDDNILLAAADLCDFKGDLLNLTPAHRRRIILAWETAVKEAS